MTTAYFYLHVFIYDRFHFLLYIMTLSINKLSKRFSNAWILKDAELNIERGSVIGIVGRKGSGKTTFLRILAGLETPSGGSIELDGVSASVKASFVPATPVSGFIQRAFHKGINTVDTAKRQSEAIIEALESSAEVLLFDDIFNFFDPAEIKTISKKISDSVKEKGKIAIISFDDFNDVYEICDVAAILADGRIVQAGEPAAVYDAPTNRVVAEVTGENNLIDARRLTSSKSELPEFQTLTGDHRVFAHKRELAALGAINQTVALAIRPEHISLSFGASFPEDNLLKATITDVNFRGATTMVGLDSNGLRLTALVLRLVGLNVGDECMVGLPPDRIHVLSE